MKKNRVKLDDDVLVQMCRDGNSNAFGFIYERYYRTVRSYILIIVKDSMLADDILQDVFVRALVSIKANNYKEEGTFKSWLLRVAHNLCIDYFRKEKRIPITFSISTSGDFEGKDKTLFYPIPDHEKNMEDQIVNKETIDDIQTLVDNLPYEQKEVFVLREFHYFSFKEISDYTNVSINTALGRMRYALINMRKQINNSHHNGKKIP